MWTNQIWKNEFKNTSQELLKNERNNKTENN